MPAISANEFYNFLVQNGNYYLHHANTVATACSFMSVGGLLSRGGIEGRGLVQTPQYTDELDRKYGIWNDIFLDGSDIHYRTRRRQAYNKYGPVLLKFHREMLLLPGLPEVWITKKNPCYWNDFTSEEDKYFADMDEIKNAYDAGNFGHSITLKAANGLLPFEPYLDQIILDDPELYIDDEYVYDIAENALRQAAEDGGIVNLNNLRINRRVCVDCNCINTYRNMDNDEFHRLFIP